MGSTGPPKGLGGTLAPFSAGGGALPAGLGLPEATGFKAIYEALKASDLDWTFFSPAAMIQPGERTGKFRLGKDVLVSAADGQSTISAEDYAIALVDELEKPANRKSIMTIGY